MLEAGENYYTIDEVAARRGAHTTAVFAAIKNGKLEAVKFGRTWAISESAMANWFPNVRRQKAQHHRRMNERESTK